MGDLSFATCFRDFFLSRGQKGGKGVTFEWVRYVYMKGMLDQYRSALVFLSSVEDPITSDDTDENDSELLYALLNLDKLEVSPGFDPDNMEILKATWERDKEDLYLYAHDLIDLHLHLLSYVELYWDMGGISSQRLMDEKPVHLC